ncbi:MAG TPA: hypothetical protein PK514_10720 [Spirochaetota bacterium]|nr:hypothetical protein [Spirochaetota bacterium]
MTPEQKRMTDNLDKTFELTELAKNLSIAKIMQDHPAISSKDVEILFWKDVHRIKNISSKAAESES